MPRTLLVCALLAGWPAVSPAQQKPQATETVIRLTVLPRAAPRPALKYQLLPELKEMNPGNPIQGYLVCFMEQRNFFFIPEAMKNREAWETMPLKDLPVREMENFGYGPNNNALRQADYAARLDRPDWQILLKIRAEGSHLLLPEVQQLRTLASALKVRFRYQVAQGHLDDALTTAKTMFALARHFDTHPSLIGDLVGIAIAYITLGPLEEMIEQPGCPNLYWALTDLPAPFMSLRAGMQGERMYIDADLTGLDGKAPLSEAQLQEIVGRITDLMKYADPKQDVRAWLKARVADEGHVRAACARLVESGLPEARVHEFPALQVLLLDERRAFEERRDDGLKWTVLPYWQAEAGLRASAETDASGKLLFGGVSSAYLKVRSAQTRLDQRLDLLRHVEALRLYAAAHDGRLPARLADIGLPLPVDPFTGKPFRYEVQGQTAILRGSPPKGQEKNAIYNVRYEVLMNPGY